MTVVKSAPVGGIRKAPPAPNQKLDGASTTVSVPVLFAVNVMLSGVPEPSIVGYDNEKLTLVMIVIGGPVGGGVGGGVVTGGATVVVVVGTVDAGVVVVDGGVPSSTTKNPIGPALPPGSK